MAITDTIIKAILTPGTGHIITGGAGLVVGSGLGAFFSSLKAQRETKLLIRKLEHLPKETAEILNENFGLILENTLKQLNDLDKGCKLKLELGNLIKPEMEEFCYIKPHKDQQAWHVLKLNADMGIHNSNASSSINIEKTIDEYFKTYLKNRETINSENRAAAVATVQLFRNISILLIQLMKAIAHLPGYENEQRLIKFKGIIKDFWANILNNNKLVNNVNKNFFQQFFSSSESQRKNLATHIESHYLALINQLIIEQRDISIQQLSQYAFNQFQQLANYFFEVIARLFDTEACKEMTEITTYKLSKGMLRAETGDQYKGTGFKPFYENGICQLLQPLAAVSEGLNQISNKEDCLSFVRYQDLFTKKESAEKLFNWKQSYLFNSINYEEQKLITEDISHISKLLFVCQALEKEFCQSAGKYGYQGLVDRGEYQAKRLMIKLFYDEATARIKSFFLKHPAVQNLLAGMNSAIWLEKNSILTKAGDNKYIQQTKLEHEEETLIHHKQIISNTVLQDRMNKLQWQRNQLDYAQTAFMDLKYLEDNKKENNSLDKRAIYDNKDSKIYLFNVCQLLQEYNLLKNIQKNSEECKSLLQALSLTNAQFTKIYKLKDDISNALFISETYSKEDLKFNSLTLKTYEICYKNTTSKIDAAAYEACNKFTSQVFGWKPVKGDSFLDVNTYIKTTTALQLNFPEDFDLYYFIKFYEKLARGYEDLYKICQNHQNPTALQQYLEEVHKLLTLMRGLIEHVTLEEEYHKRLAANNLLLKNENVSQKEQIYTLAKNVSELDLQLNQAKETVFFLENSNRKSQQILKEAENSNAEMYQLLLQDLQENIKDIESLRENLTKKIRNINQMISKESEAAKELLNLEHEVEIRTKKILERFQNYGEVFNKANEKTKEAFAQLKQQFSIEQKVIYQLKSQLNEVLSQLQSERKKLEHYKPKNGNNMILVKDFDGLFKELEDRYVPRLKLFSSYRPVKTQNLLSFIQILLSNQAALKEDYKEYKSPETFNAKINRLLNSSRVVNAYHGFCNKSRSKHVFKQIIEHFTAGKLEEALRSGNTISYHGSYIKLNQSNKLIYQNTKIECQVQSLSLVN